MTWALLLALEMLPSPLELGLLAGSQGRHADAVLLLEPPMRDAPTYDGLMALGLAEARLGRSGDARATFDRAVALDGSRPEALVERAGVDFLDKRYDAAAEGLALALARHDDAYARELRASALQLAGRTEEALDEWNRLDQPRVADVRLAGLVKTRDRVARRELPFVEGELLRAESFREARLRLQEVGVFPFVRVRAVPRDDRRADVEVAVLERSGFGTWKELAASGAYNAFLKQVRLRYFDLGGEGVVLRAEYKWESTQPHVIGSISWPRPLGLPARLIVLGVRARPEYALGDGPLTLRTNGVDVGLRRVVGSRTVVEAGWRLRQRTYSHPRPDAPDGTLSTVGLGVERSLVADLRNRLHATLRLGTSQDALGSDVQFSQGTFSLRYERELALPDEGALAPSTLASRVVLGAGGDGMPVDAMFTPGAAAEPEYPLRGHDQKEDGVLGAAPIGRSMALLNVEWRRRVLSRPLGQLGFAFFGDVIQITRTTSGVDQSLVDVGVGLRIGWAGSHVFRVDYGRSLSGDGRQAWSAGYGQAF